MAAVNGAELVRLLKEHGTGDSKLKAARQLLQEAHDAGATTPTAGQVLAALVAAGVAESTLEKARQIAATGTFLGKVASTAASIEDRLAPSVKSRPTAVDDGDLRKTIDEFGRSAGATFAAFEGELRLLKLKVADQDYEIANLRQVVATLAEKPAVGVVDANDRDEGEDETTGKSPEPPPANDPPKPPPAPTGTPGVDRPGIGPVQKGEGDGKPTAGVKPAAPTKK